jgi:PAS domain S-box-containing protein
MITTGSKDKKSFFKTNINFSIWLTTSAVIILIILLALTVNHAREKAIVEQFSSQEASIASGVAAVIEDFITIMERSAALLSGSRNVENIQTGNTKRMRGIYDLLEGKVQFIATLDENGTVISGYPPLFTKGFVGKSYQKHTFFRRIKEGQKPYISKPILKIENQADDDKSGIESIIIGVPDWNREGKFTGAILASFSMHTIADRYMCPINGIALKDFFIVGKSGESIVNSNPDMAGLNARVIKGNTGVPMEEFFPTEQKGYGEYVFKNDKGETKRNIAAYAPINAGGNLWSFVIATPYGTVLTLVRKAFGNIMLGAAGLIIVVIITGLSIARSSARRVRYREDLKRFKEREEWQSRLLREKKTIEGITEGSPIPTFVLNKDHTIILWNRACAELTGHKAKDMIGTDKHYLPFYNQKRPVIADFIIDGDIEGLEKYYGKKKIKKSERIEEAYEARDFFKNLGGKDRHLYFLAAPIYDEKGEITAVIETLQDISREKEMGQNLREYAENLQNELTENINLRKEIEDLYNYLQSIVDSLPDKIFDINSDGIINYVSRDMKRERGIVSREIKGKHFSDFVEPEHREFVLSKWENAKQGIFDSYELEVTARDGSRRNLMITPRPVKGTNRYVLVQRDITILKNLEKKYYESQKLAAVGQLSAGIAHEVRNPLSSIKMSLQILEKRIKPTGNDLKRFEIAEREVEHLEKLVNDVLIFAKPAAPRKEPSDIKEVLEHALAMAEKSISDKSIHVNKRFERGIPPVEVDSAMLEQAFLNIYHNAIDAMGKKGTLLVSVKKASNGKGSVVVEIDDNGCGINEEDLPHLFNPFFTSKQYGTGLGLSQVKKIVDLHNGAVDILSKKGEGTRFIVTLPIAEKDETHS